VTRTPTEGSLLGTNEVFVADDVVTVKEQATLLAWAEAQYHSGKLLSNPSDRGAYCTPFQSARGGLTRLTNVAARCGSVAEGIPIWVPEVDEHDVDKLPAEFWHIRARVIERLGLSELDEDHYKGSFLSYIAPGTGVHAHRDARLRNQQEEQLILRCNVLFKRPQEGGLPAIESIKIDVPDRGMWAFFPTELVHSATPVRGSEFRGLLSFGFLVHFSHLWQRRFHIAPSFELEYGLDGGDLPRQALLAQLRTTPEAQILDNDRIDLLEYVLMSAGDFSVQEVAQCLGRGPAQISDALHDLQRSKIVESNSSSCPERGKVTVL